MKTEKTVTTFPVNNQQPTIGYKWTKFDMTLLSKSNIFNLIQLQNWDKLNFMI